MQLLSLLQADLPVLNNMKNFLYSILIIGGLFISSTVFALDLGLGSAEQAAGKAGYDAANTTETTLAQNIGGVIKTILTVSGIIFTGLVFYAGYLWMLARGDEGQAQKAKDIIEMAVIGLVISLSSYGITNFVMNNIASRTLPAQVGPPSPK